MPEKCTFCKKATAQVTLGKRALKCFKVKYPNTSADDLFCVKCNEIMEGVAAKNAAKQKKRKLLERRQLSRENRQSTTSSSTGDTTNSATTIIRNIVEKTPPVLRIIAPQTSGTGRQPTPRREDLPTSPEIQYTQSQSQPQNQVLSISRTQRQRTPQREDLTGSPEIQYTQSQSQPSAIGSLANIQDSSESNGLDPPLRPIVREYDASSDDEPLICAGPSTSTAIAQPIVRKRKKPVVFADERIIPIYNRRGNFGG